VILVGLGYFVYAGGKKKDPSYITGQVM
jgi:hypothetical protein